MTATKVLDVFFFLMSPFFFFESLLSEFQVVWQFVEEGVMLYFTHHRQQQYHQKVVGATASNIFLWNKLFSNSINIIFTLGIFIFHQNFLLSTRFLCLLTSLSLVQSWVLTRSVQCITLHLVSEYQFFVIFRMLQMPVTVKKLKHTVTAFHASHVSQISSSKKLLTRTFLVCPMK